MRFLEGKYGEGSVHNEEQVKLVNPDDDDSNDELGPLSLTTLIATGGILLSVLVLAYLIFGV